MASMPEKKKVLYKISKPAVHCHKCRHQRLAQAKGELKIDILTSVPACQADTSLASPRRYRLVGPMLSSPPVGSTRVYLFLYPSLTIFNKAPKITDSASLYVIGFIGVWLEYRSISTFPYAGIYS